MLGYEIVEKSKIASRARAPGRRNPHSSSSPGKPDTWQRGVGDPMAGTWRDAKCKLPRRSSPSTENVADTEGARPSSSASDATSRSTPDDRRGHTRIRRNQSKDRATGEPDDAKVPIRVGGGGVGKGGSGYPSRLTQTGSRTPASDGTSPAAYPTRTSTDAQKPFVETLRVGIPPGKAGTSSRKRVLRAVVGDHHHEA